MTYRQLGYWDNMRGNTSLACVLAGADEAVYLERYTTGWQRANKVAKRTQQRKMRKLNGEPVHSAAD